MRAPPLAELYDLLRAEGFVIGVDDHVRIGRLLACDATWTVELLRTAVRALVVTDPDAREAFEGCWERWAGGIASSAATAGTAVSRDARSAAGSAAALPAGRAGSTQNVAGFEPPGALMRDSESSAAGEAKPSRTERPPVARRARRLTIAGIVAGIAVVAVVLVLVSRFSSGGGSSEPPAGPGGPVQPPLTAAHDAGMQPADAGMRHADAGPESAQPPLGQGGLDGKLPGAGAKAPLPGFTSLAVAFGIIVLGVAAISSLFAARGRRRFVPGPWHYRLAVPPDARPMLLWSAIEDAAVDLTWRAPGAGRELDVARSVAATVERGGLPTLVHRRQTAVPRYLVLEDTAGGSDRWQGIYDELLAGLAREGLAIERYRFVASPEHCLRPDGQAVPLGELIDHADALIVIGDGDAAIDPVDGRPADWLALLHHIPRRLWINPVPPVRWSAGAHTIAKDTPMEHGVARAITALHAGIDRPARPERPYPAVIERAPETASAVAALRAALGEPAFQLVSAVAVAAPPTLAAARWLAEVLALELDEQDWLAVATLPWFRTEVLPEGLRDRLRSALEAEAPELASAVAAIAAERHAASEPPRGSVAHLEWQLDGADRAARQGERAAADRSLRRIAATPLADAERQLRARLGLPDRLHQARRWAFAVGASLMIAGAAHHIVAKPQGPHAGVSPDLSPIAPDAGTVSPGMSPMALDAGATALDAPPTHQEAVVSVAFSPDGTRVVTASFDGTARMWDAATGKPLAPPLTHRAPVVSAAFSRNGKRVITASRDGTAQVWDAATGKPLAPPLTHRGALRSAAFSPDSVTAVTASIDKTARVWDAFGKSLSPPLTHKGALWSAAFSPDGKRVVTASDDKTARVWDAATSKPLAPPLAHQDAVVSAAFSPDGKHVVTASLDKTARVWDAATGKPVTGPLEHQDAVVSAAFSPDGKSVVTAGLDNTARVWDAVAGKPVTGPLEHQDAVWSATFSPDGKRVVTASSDNTARVWDAATGKPLGPPLTHQATVRSAAFSPDGKRVVTASDDQTARVWDAATGKPLGPPLH